MTPEQQTIRVRLNYPLERVKEPVLYHLILDYGLVPNIHRANVNVHSGGFIELDLTGEPLSIERGLTWAQAQGVIIDRIVGAPPEEGLD